MSGDFEGKVAIVTGAAQGMGEAVSRRLVSEGARVCMADRDADLVRECAAGLGPNAFAAVVDVTSEAAIKAMVAETADRWGRIDMLHNNAGVTGRGGKVLDSDAQDIDFIFAVNFRAPFFAMQAAVPHMRQVGGGSIVNMASLFGIRPARGMGVYGASKGAVISLTKTLSVELAPDNIRVNSVAPGAIETSLLRESNKVNHVPGSPSYDDRLKTHPFGRAGTPDEAANLIVFLLGSQASFISGAVYQIDGALGA